jgi:hypothetical protein
MSQIRILTRMGIMVYFLCELEEKGEKGAKKLIGLFGFLKNSVM